MESELSGSLLEPTLLATHVSIHGVHHRHCEEESYDGSVAIGSGSMQRNPTFLQASGRKKGEVGVQRRTANDSFVTLECASGLAPASIRVRQASRCPLEAAHHRGVQPSCRMSAVLLHQRTIVQVRPLVGHRDPPRPPPPLTRQLSKRALLPVHPQPLKPNSSPR